MQPEMLLGVGGFIILAVMFVVLPNFVHRKHEEEE